MDHLAGTTLLATLAGSASYSVAPAAFRHAYPTADTALAVTMALGITFPFNLAGPRPLGNSIESMDLGFTLQARCLEAVATGAVDASSCVAPVPASIDNLVASAYVELANA